MSRELIHHRPQPINGGGSLCYPSLDPSLPPFRPSSFAFCALPSLAPMAAPAIAEFEVRRLTEELQAQRVELQIKDGTLGQGCGA